jgi:hypothetical protein
MMARFWLLPFPPLGRQRRGIGALAKRNDGFCLAQMKRIKKVLLIVESEQILP